jgi:hypothetical protein
MFGALKPAIPRVGSTCSSSPSQPIVGTFYAPFHSFSPQPHFPLPSSLLHFPLHPRFIPSSWFKPLFIPSPLAHLTVGASRWGIWDGMPRLVSLSPPHFSLPGQDQKRQKAHAHPHILLPPSFPPYGGSSLRGGGWAFGAKG